MQAEAAIAAGITTLLGLLETTPAQAQRVHPAGGFGLDGALAHAIGGGRLPGFTKARVAVAGNTSLGGAFRALNDRSLPAEIQTACGRMESIELNLQPGFEAAYMDHLSL